MDGEPAGWYDDPEEPGTKRYWDGTSWTDDRAPSWDSVSVDAQAPFDPLGEPPADGPGPDDRPASDPAGPGDDPGRASASGGSDRRGLYVLGAVLGVLVVIGLVALVAALRNGGDDLDRTEVVNRIVPNALQQNYADQGLDVTVYGAACNEVPDQDGPFSTTCTIGFVGTERTLVATVSGSIIGDEATVSGASTDTYLLDEDLAISGAQQLVNAKVSGLTVTACQLAEVPLLLQDGDQFTCSLQNGQTATFTVEDGTFVLSAASAVGP